MSKLPQQLKKLPQETKEFARDLLLGLPGSVAKHSERQSTVARVKRHRQQHGGALAWCPGHHRMAPNGKECYRCRNG